MRTSAKIAVTILSGILLLNINQIAFAADTKDNCPPGPNGEIRLCNPIGEGATVMTVLTKIFDTMMTVMLVVVPIFIVIGAFQMMFAAGNPEKFATGQKTILYSVIGLVIILMAKGIVAIVTSILKV